MLTYVKSVVGMHDFFLLFSYREQTNNNNINKKLNNKY